MEVGCKVEGRCGDVAEATKVIIIVIIIIIDVVELEFEFFKKRKIKVTFQNLNQNWKGRTCCL